MAATTRTAVKPAAKRHAILRRPGFFIFSIYPDQAGTNIRDSRGGGLERETGFEPATLSLGMGSAACQDSAAANNPLDSLDAKGVPAALDRSGFAAFVTREAPIEPHAIARDACSASDGPRASRAAACSRPAFPMREAWLRVREVAAQLRVSTAMVYRLIERGELTHVRVSNAIRISPAELAAYFEKNP